MRQPQCFGDERNKGFCVHCGGAPETNDHVSSKVLLDKPYPENLMGCPACRTCNNGLSADEEYLACLQECAIAGEAEPSVMRRPKIARILNQNAALLARLRQARTVAGEVPMWAIECERARNVILKLARCHAAFEQNEPQLEEPDYLRMQPLALMSDEERSEFEGQGGDIAFWPEMGSRAMQRLLVTGADVFSEGWLIVQEGNYALPRRARQDACRPAARCRGPAMMAA